MTKPLSPVEKAAQEVLFSLYSLDYLIWQAKDVGDKGHFDSHFIETKYSSEFSRELTGDAKAVFEAFPALAMLRLGIIVEDCVKLICNVLHPEYGIAFAGVRSTLSAIDKKHGIDVKALRGVWEARSRVAHNSEAVVAWEELTAHSNAVWKFVETFAALPEPKRFVPPTE